MILAAWLRWRPRDGAPNKFQVIIIVLLVIIIFLNNIGTISSSSSSSNQFERRTKSINSLNKTMEMRLDLDGKLHNHNNTNTNLSTSNSSSSLDNDDYGDNNSSLSLDSSAICSDENTLNIDNIYRLQTKAEQLYRNICGKKFIKIFKFNETNDKDMLIFGSIYAPHSTQLNFQLISQLSSVASFEYFLVMRVYFATLPHSEYLSLRVDSIPYRIDRNQSDRESVVEYLVPVHFAHTHIPDISLANGPDQPYLSESYVFVCLRYQSSLKCAPQYFGNEISCYCVDVTQRGYVYVCVIFVLILAVIIGLIVYAVLHKTIPEPEVQFNLILCMPGHSSHEYLVIFRVGPASQSFNYDTSYIDFQLLGPQDEQIGIPVRFSCKYLHDHLYGEMHMFVGRISPIPLVQGIMANHSHSNNLIFFYDFSVIALHEDNEIVQEESINQYILNEPLIFRPQAPDVDDQRMVRQRVRLQHLMAKQLTELEFIAITAFVIGFVACLVMVQKRYLNFYSNWNNARQMLFQVFISILVISLLGWVLILIIEMLYKYVIKSNYIDESYKQLITESTENCHKITWLLWIVMLYVGGLALCIVTICLSLKVDFISIWLWSGMTFLIGSLVIGSWFCIEVFPLFKYFFCYCTVLTEEEFGRSGSEEHSQRLPSNEQHTFNSFPRLFNFKTISSSSQLEPKMVNPNFKTIRQQQKSLRASSENNKTSAATGAAAGTGTNNNTMMIVASVAKNRNSKSSNNYNNTNSAIMKRKSESVQRTATNVAKSTSSNFTQSSSAGSITTAASISDQLNKSTCSRSKYKFKLSMDTGLVGSMAQSTPGGLLSPAAAAAAVSSNQTIINNNSSSSSNNDNINNNKIPMTLKPKQQQNNSTNTNSNSNRNVR